MGLALVSIDGWFVCSLHLSGIFCCFDMKYSEMSTLAKLGFRVTKEP
jgi:hypothetical protein